MSHLIHPAGVIVALIVTDTLTQARNMSEQSEQSTAILSIISGIHNAEKNTFNTLMTELGRDK